MFGGERNSRASCCRGAIIPGLLPINIDNRLHNRGVESERLELKASWDPKTAGPQARKTICAYANDCHNLNGGYVVFGVAEKGGRAVLPPIGLKPEEIESGQRWLRGRCSQLDPPCQPVIAHESFRDRDLLVVWAPGSETRPHRAPEGPGGALRFWVRLGSETIDAERRGSSVLGSLIGMTARVPLDDRRARGASMADLREAKVREHLRQIDSALQRERDSAEVYRRMRITTRVNDHEIPRNVGLLFFSDEPTRWFPSAVIEVAQFAADRAGHVQEERVFRGGLVDQYVNCIRFLEGLNASRVKKVEGRSQAERWAAYPARALRETLVNALYHRSYQPDQPEPTKVYVYPEKIVITSYPDPVPGLERKHFARDERTPDVPARNRRIGEFMKEFRLAEDRLTGLPLV